MPSGGKTADEVSKSQLITNSQTTFAGTVAPRTAGKYLYLVAVVAVIWPNSVSSAMDKYLVPSDSIPQIPKPFRRNRWKLSTVELNGKLDPKYRQELSGLLVQSYAEVGAFPHLYHIDGVFCPTSSLQMNRITEGAQGHQLPFKKSVHLYRIIFKQWDVN
ncbi:Transducin/WD40 repeat-like superfamily protein isoform 3 [Cucumis melo var. makuwa]|uniref:Transducin/WD40 repeat-like superfamily protein isoform 3 n=1 Tax=Cucumis melo var. makuwa TaxID=1194695 RepID=A0A5A7UA99_CUCMM|nr:Transducin/WD40 repeat-like superfamily protein isoform 3 [Cucumis melo var. makuwa]